MVTRGTTSTITYELPFVIDDVFDTIWVTFAQDEQEIFTIKTPDLVFGGNEVIINLTQEQTLGLDSAKLVQMQLRFFDSFTDKSVASNILRTSVGALLKEGVINAEI